ncbi:inositol monophosphatase [Alphaproteobacteria bacterium]|nr:inositol monophosphatase [Alphaproteobacteria bacterium]
MRYSANLNIIIKALEKASNHLARDFMELENLQSNPNSANKFAILSQNRVKQILIDEFSKFRANYDIRFSDGEEIIRTENNEYSFAVIALDGIDNLARSNPDFVTAVALLHRSSDNKFETIALATIKVIGGELFYCEKGFGAYLNNRRIRVSKRNHNQHIVVNDSSCKIEKNILQRCYGSPILSISYFASARCEQVYLESNNSFVKYFFLLAKEAGGKVEEVGQQVIISNV